MQAPHTELWHMFQEHTKKQEKKTAKNQKSTRYPTLQTVDKYTFDPKLTMTKRIEYNSMQSKST